MWIMMNDAFVSIVADRESRSFLRVRARLEGDIERVFPGAEVQDRGQRADYRFLALVPRADVARVVAQRILDVGYDNFKSSVPERDRHDAYLSVWSVMRCLSKRRERARDRDAWPDAPAGGYDDLWAADDPDAALSDPALLEDDEDGECRPVGER